MPTHGVRVSKPGFDVKTCDDIDCVYSSKYNSWKILDHGNTTVNTTATVAHGLSFSPAAIVYHNYTDREGNGGKYIQAGFQDYQDTGFGVDGMNYWTDTTNLNLVSTKNLTAYYFIMMDPAETGSDSTADSKKFGVRITQDGKDVFDAEDSECSLTSKFKTLKESESGATTITLADTLLNGAITNVQTTITVDSTTGFPDAGVIWIEDNGGAGNPSEAVKYTGKTSTTFTGCTRGYWGTTNAAHNDNLQVEVGYGKATIAHGLSYAPAFSVYMTASGFARQCPHFVNNSLPTGAVAVAFSDTTNLEIRLERDDPDIGSDWTALSGSYPFRYYIFKDSIT